MWRGFLHPTRVGFPAKTYQELADEYLYMYQYMYICCVYIYIYTYTVYVYVYVYTIYIYRLSGFDHQTQACLPRLGSLSTDMSHWCRGSPGVPCFSSTHL